MTNLKTLHSISMFLIYFGTGLWFVETLLFQIIYGYHWRPYNDVELYFDRAAGLICAVGIGLLLFTFGKALKRVIDELPDDTNP